MSGVANAIRTQCRQAGDHPGLFFVEMFYRECGQDGRFAIFAFRDERKNTR